MKSLSEVRSFLNDIPYINNGGCGIAAYSIYLWLKKHKKLNSGFEFIFMHSNDCDLWENKCALYNKNITPWAPSHIIIKHRNLLLDVEPGIRYYNEKYSLIIKDEKYIIDCINNVNAWCDWFNRRKYVPIIESKLGIKLNIKLK